MTLATRRANAALFAFAVVAIAAAPLPAVAADNYYFYPAGASAAADATLQAEQPYPYENRDPIDTEIEAVAIDGPSPQFRTLKMMRKGSSALGEIHLLPGTYRIRVACESGAYDTTFVSDPVAISAGQDYFIECRGQTRDQARVSVSSQSAAEGHGIRGIRAKTFDLPAGASVDAVADDLNRSLKGRGWDITAATPGHIDATLHAREHMAAIRIAYDERQVTFSYVDSSNLEYVVENGVASVHHNYYNWINYLGSDVLTYLRGEVPEI